MSPARIAPAFDIVKHGDSCIRFCAHRRQNYFDLVENRRLLRNILKLLDDAGYLYWIGTRNALVIYLECSMPGTEDLEISEDDALIVVDVQNDFLPGGRASRK